MQDRSYHGPDRENREYHRRWPAINERHDDYYEPRRHNRDKYPALPLRGQQYPKRRTVNNQKTQFESYLQTCRPSGQLRNLLRNSEPVLKPKVAQPMSSHQEEAGIPEENKPTLKGVLNVDGVPTDNLHTSNLDRVESAVVEAEPSKPQEPDPREEEIRKLKIRTDSWSAREFLDLVKYTRDIILALCYVLAAPVNLQFPNCRRFGPTVEPIFRGPTADVVNI